MKILVTTGLSEKDIGGPFQYAPRLKEEFQAAGHEVKVVSYGRVEKLLPIGFRHLYFFLKILPSSIWADYILTLDTYSAGVPSVMAAMACSKKIIVRVGGDSVWSAYVNRIGSSLVLSEFYKKLPKMSWKEKLMMFFTRFLVKKADFLAFNTEWQKKIWGSYYEIKNAGVVRNYIPERTRGEPPEAKIFLWAGRLIPEKNIEFLRAVGNRLSSKHPLFRLDIVTGEAHDKLLEKISNSYAVVSPAFSDICPNFILEGASFNKPFVMTGETGLNEIYPKGGIFFNPLKEEELESAMEAMLDYRVYNKSVEDLKQINPKHTWKDMAEEYLSIWKRL